ncbi:MAG TPA: glycosyltransferase family A protein [Sphingomicrobium sp.]|nr:glycosyltransferase family A protein [Sphingomicrobium sp.]
MIATPMPSFSIVIPTFQRRDAVCEAVRALGKLHYDGQVEVIVVVDGSTDRTEAALQAIDCPFPKTILSQDNKGAAAARNRGAAEATGEIILFLDDDMLCESDTLEQHARMYKDGADAVIGDFPIDPGSPQGFLTDWIAEKAHWDREGTALTPFEIFTGHLSVRRAVFEDLGGFDESFTAGGHYGNEDIDFGARLLERYQVRHNPQAITRQRSTVSPRQFMRRARSLARNDLRFAAKHPKLARELFARRGAGRTSRRLRLLSRIPLMPATLGAVSLFAAEIGLKTRFRSSRKLSYLIHGAWLAAYWSEVRAGGRPDSDASGAADL